MPNVAFFIVTMNVIMLRIAMLNVVAPCRRLYLSWLPWLTQQHIETILSDVA
jgi:hypothetical protein